MIQHRAVLNNIDAQNKTNTTTLASYRAFCITIPYFYNHDDIDADNTYINYYADTIRGRNRSIYTTTVSYGRGRTINTTCCVNDNDDTHHILCLHLHLRSFRHLVCLSTFCRLRYSVAFHT